MQILDYDPTLLPSAVAKDLFDTSGGYQVATICNVLGVEVAAFARLTDRSTESVAKTFNKVAMKPRHMKTLNVVKELVQIIIILRAMSLEEHAALWMRTPIPSFEGRTPFDLIQDGRGQELVSRLVSIATGNVGT